MDFKKIGVLFLLTVIMFCLIFGGVAGKVGLIKQKVKAAENDGKYEANVIRLEGGDWGYPTPYAHYPRGPGGFKMCLIFDSLLERGEKGLIPWLAKDYQIKNGGKQYLFTLRKNIKWQDGKSLTAKDVKFSLEYATEHPMVWSYISKGDIKKVEVKNKYQVLVTVKEPDASLLYNLGRTRIIPRHIWQGIKTPKEFTGPEAVIGSGPYILSDYSKEHGTYRFKAFDKFWGPEQKVKTIEFVPVSEPILAFEKGKIGLTRISPDLLGRYQNNSEYKVIQRPAFWGYRLLFNMGDKSVAKRKKFRQAINYALDKKELIAKIERGAGVPGSAGILPPDHIFYNPEVKEYHHNLTKARKLMKDVLKEKPLSLDLKVPGNAVRLAELISEQLAKADININIISSDRKTHDSRVRNMKYELAILGHGGWGGEPDYLRRFVGKKSAKGGISPLESGLRGYNNPQLNSLLLKQKQEFNRTKRKEIFYEIQNILAEDVPEIPLYYTSGYTVFRPEKYNGWMFMFDHHSLVHSKLSYLERK